MLLLGFSGAEQPLNTVIMLLLGFSGAEHESLILLLFNFAVKTSQTEEYAQI